MKRSRLFFSMGATAAAAAVMLAASGCSGVKNCQAPDIDIPQRISAMAEADSLALADLSWDEFYTDKALNQLITKALANNRRLLGADARMRQLEALYGVARANQLPQASYLAQADRETNDYSGRKWTNDPEIDLKVTVGWEIDFWGRLKWTKEKAKSDYLGSANARRSMEMLIISEVASTYFRLLALDNELAIVNRTLITRKESMELARLRFEGGLTAETVYQQAKVEYATTSTLVPNLEARISATLNQLALLTGEFPGQPITRGSIDTEFFLPDTLSAVVSSRLLQRRPDIAEAEHALRAAMADVGITYADRFPAIRISLSGGLENNELKRFLKSPFSYVAGTVAGPLIDMGRRKRSYKAALAAYDVSRLAYEQKVLEAFGEASDAVTNYSEARKTTVLRAELRDAARKYVELARLQYRGGSISYLDVLDAQRRYFDAQIGLSNAVRDERLMLVALYKALGGGWSRSDVERV